MNLEYLCATPGPAYLRYQKHGEEHLKGKRWKLAKSALDQALSRAGQDINKSSSTLIKILDLRVEAQLRLENLAAATKDARTMIRHDRADPRGYLRCGQLARLKYDDVEARNWYEQGLKRVPNTNEGYQNLESMNLKMSLKIASQKYERRDPLSILPVDLIHMLFDYLDFWEATSCLRVSKTWRNNLLAIHSIWKTFDFLGAKKPISQKSMKACIRRLPSSPTTVRLGSLSDPALAYLQPYIQRWDAIEDLCIIKLPQLLASDCAWAISTSLKYLHIGARCPVDFAIIEDLLYSCDTLKRVRFDYVQHGSLMENDDPSMMYIPCLMQEHYQQRPRKSVLPELTHLELTCKEAKRSGYLNTIGLFRNFPNLMDLRCEGVYFPDHEENMSMARSLLHLELWYWDGLMPLLFPDGLEDLICGDTFLTLGHPILSSMLYAAEAETYKAVQLKNLKTLELDIRSFTFSRFVPILTVPSPPTLTRLVLLINGCGDTASELILVAESGRLGKLVELRLSTSDWNDRYTQLLVAHCPLLEYVSIESSNITGVSVKTLCTATAITTLVLRGCYRVSGDAIEWARARGLQVRIAPEGKRDRLSVRRFQDRQRC